MWESGSLTTNNKAVTFISTLFLYPFFHLENKERKTDWAFSSVNFGMLRNLRINTKTRNSWKDVAYFALCLLLKIITVVTLVL